MRGEPNDRSRTLCSLGKGTVIVELHQFRMSLLIHLNVTFVKLAQRLFIVDFLNAIAFPCSLQGLCSFFIDLRVGNCLPVLLKLSASESDKGRQKQYPYFNRHLAKESPNAAQVGKYTGNKNRHVYKKVFWTMVDSQG